MILVLFALVSGQAPPDVNESHYLTKAKHGWDNSWCPDDLFLSSTFSHWLFYLTTGWLHAFLSLNQVAWVGRFLTWSLIAFGWQRLSSSVMPHRGAAVVSAAIFLLLNERFHLAGEWVVGGFEAKGFAYGFVLLALATFIRKSWNVCFVVLGCATAYHVLVGGWAWIALLVAIMMMNTLGQLRWDSAFQSFVPGLSLGILISLVGVLPPLLSDSAAASSEASIASSIYVNQRIAHHLQFSSFPTIFVARFLVLVVGLFFLGNQFQRQAENSEIKWRKLFWFAVGSLLISFVGLVLSGVAESSSNSWFDQLLRFYWFRLSDFAVPCAVAMGCTIVLVRLALGPDTQNRVLQRVCASFFLFAIAAAFIGLVIENNWDSRPNADRAALPSFEDDLERSEGTYRNWREACAWIAENTPRNAVFITPAEQQTFKWYAERTEIVCWKDVPQDPNNIIEWRQRVSLFIEPQRRYPTGLMSYTDQQLQDLAKQHGATHLLVPQASLDLLETPTELRQVYPEDATARKSYVVFEFD